MTQRSPMDAQNCRTLFLLVTILSFTHSVTQAYDYTDLKVYPLLSLVCPKECVCPPSFPHALYCDNKGLNQVPLVPARTWYLYLQNNLIESLSEESFANATELKWINLSRNKLTNKNISKNLLKQLKSLLYLYLDDNDLEEVPAPLPESIEQIRLARNKISKIPEGVFGKLGNLTLLDLHHNKLTDSSIQADAFNGLKSLMQLNLAKNSLKKMPPGLPLNTIQLYLDNNNIEEIPKNYFSGITRITFIQLNYNKLSDTGVPVDVFNVSSILDLQLSYNELTSVPIVNGHLERLHLDHNKIKNINGTISCPEAVKEEFDPHFPQGPRLRYLRLDGNDIQPPIPLNLMICFRLLQIVVI